LVAQATLVATVRSLVGDRTLSQALCYESANGLDWMWRFDEMPKHVRELLRNSAFNLCTECVHERINEGRLAEEVIAEMERDIQSLNGGPQ